MANRYANLVGSNKIKDEYTKINQGFDLVEQDIDKLQDEVEYIDDRVDQIISDPTPGKDPELVDIRTPDPSYTPQRTINVAGDVTRDMQAQFVAHKADLVTSATGAHGMKIESGIFTPTLQGQTTAGNHTYSTQTGAYYRINSLVYFMISLILSQKDPTMSGNVIIAGLPFVASGGLAIAPVRYLNINFPAEYETIVAQVGGGSTVIPLYLLGRNIGAPILDSSAIMNTTAIQLSGVYRL